MTDKLMMHAVQCDSYGGGAAGLKHVEIPIPKPSKGELLLKIEATSINPVDWKIQKGMLRPLFPLKFPWIPATDVAGEVLDVGPGVKNFKTGDKVVSMLNIFKGGGLAQYAVSSEKLTVSRPPEVSAAEGAGLPVAGLTALQALTYHGGLTLDKTGPTSNILITAASGGVGQYAVQLAKLGNIHVTATCGARNIGFVKTLGADEVLDYKTSQGATLTSPSDKKYDVVIHCATPIPWSTFEPNLSPIGKVIDITPGPSAFWTAVVKKVTCSKKQLVPILLFPKAKNLEYMVGLVKEGKLKTIIDSKHPLNKAEEAWAKSIDGHATVAMQIKAIVCVMVSVMSLVFSISQWPIWKTYGNKSGDETSLMDPYVAYITNCMLSLAALLFALSNMSLVTFSCLGVPLALELVYILFM